MLKTASGVLFLAAKKQERRVTCLPLQTISTGLENIFSVHGTCIKVHVYLYDKYSWTGRVQFGLDFVLITMLTEAV